MKKKQRIIMPLEYVEKSLAYLDLKYTAKELPKGECTQLGLLSDGFDHININTYATGTVVVQPHDDTKAIILASYFALRAKNCYERGKFKPGRLKTVFAAKYARKYAHPGTLPRHNKKPPCCFYTTWRFICQ